MALLLSMVALGWPGRGLIYSPDALEAAAALDPDCEAPASLLERIASERGGTSLPAGEGGR